MYYLCTHFFVHGFNLVFDCGGAARVRVALSFTLRGSSAGPLWVPAPLLLHGLRSAAALRPGVVCPLLRCLCVEAKVVYVYALWPKLLLRDVVYVYALWLRFLARGSPKRPPPMPGPYLWA